MGGFDEDTLFAYQSHCSMLLLNKVESEQNVYNFATKRGEYLALGNPVITTSNGEVTNYIQDNVSCLFKYPKSPDEIAESISRLLKDRALADKIGNEGKRVARNEFDFRAQSKKISQFFESLDT